MNKTLMAAVALFAFGAGISDASAFKYSVLHNFCSVKNCGDGVQAIAAPISDSAGNFYGTTSAGGSSNTGTVYRLSPNGKKWTYTTLYTFCSLKNCTDGAAPKAGLIIDTKGNLYGITNGGGKQNGGAVFELSQSGGTWTNKVIYSFCSKANCTDGNIPTLGKLAYQGQLSGAPYDGTSPLYGVTNTGGANNQGALISLTPNKGSWTEAVVYAFCAKANCTDGAVPFGSPIVDDSGNVFGTAVGGGANAHGAVYEAQRAGKGWNYVVLYSFCTDKNTCTDGASPIAGLFQDGAGNLYGTTAFGGANVASGSGGGTVFKIIPNGAHSKHIKLHDFCAETNCTDGTFPEGSVTMDAKGHLIGVTANGGDMNMGTLYSLSGPKLSTFTRVFFFGDTTTPGAIPIDPPAIDTKGSMFGTTVAGGTQTDGVVYKFTP